MQIAVLKEVDGKGPFCTLVMAVVVVKDVVVIVSFALNLELIRVVSINIPAFTAMTVDQISMHQVRALWLVCAGHHPCSVQQHWAAAVEHSSSGLERASVHDRGGVRWPISQHNYEATLPPRPQLPVRNSNPAVRSHSYSCTGCHPHLPVTMPRCCRARMIMILISSTCIFKLAHYFDAEPLLACVTMGMVVVNRRYV